MPVYLMTSFVRRRKRCALPATAVESFVRYRCTRNVGFRG